MRRGYLDAARTLQTVFSRFLEFLLTTLSLHNYFGFQEAHLSPEEAQVAEDIVDLLETEEALRAGNLMPAITWVEKRRALLDPDFTPPAATISKEESRERLNETGESASVEPAASDTSCSSLLTTPRAIASASSTRASLANPTSTPANTSSSLVTSTPSSSTASASVSASASSYTTMSAVPSVSLYPIGSSASTPTATPSVAENSPASGLIRFTSLAPTVAPMQCAAFNLLPLEFRLHRLQFLELLRAGRTRDALNYSKKMSPFANRPGCSKGSVSVLWISSCAYSM